MMDLIVLGIIPGTHIQLSFSAFGLITVVAVVLIACAIYLSNSRRHVTAMRRQFDFISLQNLEQA